VVVGTGGRARVDGGRQRSGQATVAGVGARAEWTVHGNRIAGKQERGFFVA
jgi:hypothetical protein